MCEIDFSTIPRFVLYDFDTDSLASTQVFYTYTEAADAADPLPNILILAIAVPHRDGDPSEVEETPEEPCECEKPGYYHCGIPGVLAHFEHGRLALGASVERCDLCERFPTDRAARERLIELGLA
jgi:hypothetical protein